MLVTYAFSFTCTESLRQQLHAVIENLTRGPQLPALLHNAKAGAGRGCAKG